MSFSQMDLLKMKFTPLYKVKKKILVWMIETKHYDLYSEYTVTHGQKDGKLQSTSTKIDSGKNIGKANETSIEQQCELEAKALWQKQIDRKGYHEDMGSSTNIIRTIMIPSVPSPMLAVEYDKCPHKVEFPCYVQPKLDGVRCLAYLRADRVVLLSRQRKEFNHLDHIRNQLAPLFQKFPDLILDGELYSHKYTFQEIISAIKRDEPNDLTKEVEYHIYDIVESKTPFKDRLDSIFNDIVPILKQYNTTHINNVYTTKVNSEGEIKMEHGVWTKSGYEGVMIRNAKGMYKQDGRSQDLLKYKKFMDQEFPIVGADQNKGKLSNTCTFQLDYNGTVFSAMPDGSEEERSQLYEDWKKGLIKKGDLATVKFFNWTNGEHPVPRFPILKAVRSYE